MPFVEYGDDDDVENVEAEAPDGWSVDWGNSVALTGGRSRAPLVLAGDAWTHTITERGNGFPDLGDLVSDGPSGLLLRVTRMGPIHTSAPGVGNYVYAVCVETTLDWADLAEDVELHRADPAWGT